MSESTIKEWAFAPFEAAEMPLLVYVIVVFAFGLFVFLTECSPYDISDEAPVVSRAAGYFLTQTFGLVTIELFRRYAELNPKSMWGAFAAALILFALFVLWWLLSKMAGGLLYIVVSAVMMVTVYKIINVNDPGVLSVLLVTLVILLVLARYKRGFEIGAYIFGISLMTAAVMMICIGYFTRRDFELIDADLRLETAEGRARFIGTLLIALLRMGVVGGRWMTHKRKQAALHEVAKHQVDANLKDNALHDTRGSCLCRYLRFCCRSRRAAEPTPGPEGGRLLEHSEQRDTETLTKTATAVATPTEDSEKRIDEA
jgi:hypothetical protein